MARRSDDEFSDAVRRYTPEEEDFLRRNPGDEARMAQALGYREPYTHGGDSEDAIYGPRGATGRRYTPEEEDFLRRNPGDEARMAQALGNVTDRGPRRSTGAYQQYLQPTAEAAPDPLLAALVSQLQADRTRQEQERSEMRGILMSQLAGATQPVSADDPGIRPVLNAQALASQRSAQRQRSALAERLGAQGLGDSGALQSGIGKIEQHRGEADAAMTAQILGNELNAKRAQVMSLLDLAVRSGDSAAARTLQGQLQAVNEQMRQLQFNADLGLRSRALDLEDVFRRDNLGFQRYAFDTGEASQRYRFDNDLGFRLAQLQLMGNQNALGFLGGLI